MKKSGGEGVASSISINRRRSKGDQKTAVDMACKPAHENQRFFRKIQTMRLPVAASLALALVGASLCASPALAQTVVDIKLGLNSPSAVAVAGNGDISFVENNSVQKISSGLTTTRYGDATLRTNAGMAFDGLGNLLVIDQATLDLLTVTPADFVSRVNFALRISGVAVNAGGDMFYGQSAGFELYLQKQLAAGGAPFQFSPTPMNILDLALDSDGNVYVADGSGGRIMKVPAAGGPATQFATKPWPVGIAIDGNNNVYVVSNVTNAISKYTPAGVETTVLGGLNNVTDVALDGAGNIYFTEGGTMPGTGAVKKIVMTPPAPPRTGPHSVRMGDDPAGGGAGRHGSDHGSAATGGLRSASKGTDQTLWPGV